MEEHLKEDSRYCDPGGILCENHHIRYNGCVEETCEINDKIWSPKYFESCPFKSLQRPIEIPCYWESDLQKTICPKHGHPIGECLAEDTHLKTVLNIFRGLI